jgi:hypothetical protein
MIIFPWHIYAIIILLNWRLKMTSKKINSLKPYKATNILIKKANSNEKYGFMRIRTITELGTTPVENASVTVYATLDEAVPLSTHLSDSNGLVPLFIVPVSYDPKDIKMDPVYYFTEYDIKVSHEDYYNVFIYGIQMFPNITTNFDINLTKIPPERVLPSRERIIHIPKIDL